MLSLLLSLSLCGTPARAESSGTLSKGAQVAYVGAALNTYGSLQRGDDAAFEVDRALRPRLDLYYARGLSQRLQLAAYLPLVYSTVVDGSAGPCASGRTDDHCTPALTIGGPGLELRGAAIRDPFDLTVGAGVLGDPWNADIRGRYTASGDATLGLRPALYAGKRFQLGSFGLGVVGTGAYTYLFGRAITEGPAGEFRAPADLVSGAVELHLEPKGPVRVELGLSGVQRLWGLDWDEGYTAHYFPTDDRWTVLWYSHLAGTAKLSLSLPRDMGIHLGAQRVLSVRNGPPDTLDLTLGVHKYYGG